jgi:hypothetical protein
MPATRLRLADPGPREFEAAVAGASAKRRQVGFGREVAPNAVEGSGTALLWQAVGAYRIAKLRVLSPGALTLRVGLSVASAASPIALRVAGSDDEAKVLGVVQLRAADLYWTPATEGEAQVVELAIPIGEPEPAVEIVRVSHLVSGPATRFGKTLSEVGNSLSCEIDVACVSSPSQALLNAAKSTVQMLSTQVGGGSFLCTGALLNDTDASTQIPYLISGNHCFDGETPPFHTAAQLQSVSSTLNTYFFFDASACGSRTPVANWVQRFGGAQYLYSNLSQDILFVQLNDPPPSGFYLSGWDPNPLSASTPITILHHAAGDLKKFTTGTTLDIETIPSPVDAPTGFWRVAYNQGVTEGGSSGAGLFTFNTSLSQYVLRGSLWGGDNFLCSSRGADGYYVGNDFYSRLDVAYPALARWLNPAAAPAINATDLWWGGLSESGWGINLNHQGNIIFATLFTYAQDGRPLWLVASNLALQGDGSYSGSLFQLTGTYYANPVWSAPSSLNTVGVMTIRFSGNNAATLTYTVNGVGVVKQIQRQVFSTQPTCTFTSGSRAASTNYQDLWWNPNESGWGMNITHQGNILFTTLFVYGSTGRDAWFVASALNLQPDGSYLGDLLQTNGPPFFTVPWTPIGFASVGTMRVRFLNGESALLTYNVGANSVSKSIQRQVFSSPQTVCR